MNRFLIRKFIIRYYSMIDRYDSNELAKSEEFKKITTYISNVLKSKLSLEDRRYL